METLGDELTMKVRDKIIELFGPESALAQAMEDEDFFGKLADLVAYIYGLVALSQPKPQPPEIEPLKRPWTDRWHDTTWRWDKWLTTIDDSFVQKLWSAVAKYER